MEEKRAFITGITGQDGSYLSELFLEKDCEVHGLVRRSSSLNRTRIDHVFDAVSSTPRLSARRFLHYGDLTDASSVNRLLREIKPDEIYNLGAQSHVKISFEIPEYTGDTAGLGTLRLLEGTRESGLTPRFYQASSSEMFGLARETPQRESTPFHPRSPYGAAKAYAHWLAVNYREAYGMFICNGILFNHESPRRGENFVTRKISLGVARIKLGLQTRLQPGNLEAKRDWGYAGDYVEAMWLMLQQPAPDDFAVATGETHTVRGFCQARSTVERGLGPPSGMALLLASNGGALESVARHVATEDPTRGARMRLGERAGGFLGRTRSRYGGAWFSSGHEGS